jgi:ADP-ribosylglycohydrolase
MRPFSSDAILGCLIGDAIGSSVEGGQTIPPFAELVRHRHTVTDDTQLTLATCEAITAAQTIDPEAIAASMLRWCPRGQVTGLGSSTLKALNDLDAPGFTGREPGGGNGAAIRIAPLAFVLDFRLPESRRTVRDVCRITHHSDEAYAGALTVGLAILGQPFSDLPDTNVRDQIVAENHHHRRGRFGNSDYVAESVPAPPRIQAGHFKSKRSGLLAPATIVAFSPERSALV